MAPKARPVCFKGYRRPSGAPDGNHASSLMRSAISSRDMRSMAPAWQMGQAGVTHLPMSSVEGGNSGATGWLRSTFAERPIGHGQRQWRQYIEDEQL